MRHPLLHRFRVLLGALVPALACWFLLPGTEADRLAVATSARSFANPPIFVSGAGTRNAPWQLRTFATTIRSDERQAPLIVSLGDDPDGFFQSNPPSPIDLAVILKNFQRLGTRKAATAAVLAWSDPDPIGLLALEKTIAGFDSVTVASPLARGAVPESMPPAFRAASIPLSSIRGNPNNLPVVNHIPLKGVILGKDNTRAGFQTLDSEPATRFPPLLARWEDRVVFAFPVIAAIQRLDLPVESIEITLGQYLRIGPHGPVIPLDEFGRLPLDLADHQPLAEIPAEQLIDGDDSLFPSRAPQPVILRDDRSAAEPATRAFSENLSALVTALSSDTGLSRARTLRRLPPANEFILIGLLALGLAAIAHLRSFPRNICLLTATTLVLATQLIATSHALWLPGISALAAIGFTYLTIGIKHPANSTKPAKPKPASDSAPQRPPEPAQPTANHPPAAPKPANDSAPQHPPEPAQPTEDTPAPQATRNPTTKAKQPHPKHASGKRQRGKRKRRKR
ncbi:MAG: hypothetical protein ACQCXQ_08640 [Verrucomicrobiales bacterium]|nr:hypothetical protein [Verrucomicrobiota bacterium JB025]